MVKEIKAGAIVPVFINNDGICLLMAKPWQALCPK